MIKWRHIKGYEGLYMVSSDGDVLALKRTWVTGKGLIRVKEEQLLKLFPKSNGYLHTQLTKDGIMKQVAVHRLVAEAFISNPLNKKCVNHINGIKTDNNVSNLEWATYKENNNHALDNGLRVMTKDSKGKFVSNQMS